MKVETRKIQRLKLRSAMDKAAFDLGANARKVIKKRKVFTYFLLYRLAAAFVLPFLISAYIIIARYVDTGNIRISLFSAELFSVSILCAVIVLLLFRKKTAGIRHLIDSIVDNRPYTDSIIIKAYRESFNIPRYITACEFILSFLFILVPVIIMVIKGIAPENVEMRELVLGWWLGTLALLITSFMFNQLWVERTLERLYDHGIRVSADSGIQRNSNIYSRFAVFTGSIIITLILLYVNMLYRLSAKIPGQTSQYMIQVAFISLVILAGIYVFFSMILSSVKRSFDILAYKMRSVQGGDYSVRIMNHRDDQIGRLYDDFDYLVSTLNSVLSSLEEEVHKRTAKLEEVTSKISKYVPPQLYSKIYSEESELALTYTRKKLTIFFSDIVGFTNTSENLAPEDLSRILNQYLDSMAEVALKWGGTIDKYIGDAIMIFFGDPEFTNDRDHAVRCVSMALEMLGRLEQLQVEWADSGITFPLHVRIGINTGVCTVGNFGSESRMDYTVIGGAVNLASRLESAAPADGIMVSEATYLLVKEEFSCEPSGEIMLKGIEHPVKTYTVRSRREISADTVKNINLPGFHLDLNPEEITGESRKEIQQILKQVQLVINRIG